MRRAIEFMREQRVVVARWVAMDEDYLNVVRERGDNDEGVVRRLHDKRSLLDELDDAIETLEEGL